MVLHLPPVVSGSRQVIPAKLSNTSPHYDYLWKGSWRATCLAPAWRSYSFGEVCSGNTAQTGSTGSIPETSSLAFPAKWYSVSFHQWPIQMLELQLLEGLMVSYRVDGIRRTCSMASVAHAIALSLPVHNWGSIHKFPVNNHNNRIQVSRLVNVKHL